jgi:peptidoglycan/LPS O-acetylase OafA/YrhL
MEIMTTRQLGVSGNSDAQNENIQHLRAIACLFVLCHHFHWLQPAIPYVLWYAWSGVDLFFAISGYVITLSFWRTMRVETNHVGLIERMSTNKGAIQAFFVKRFWRIVPPVVVTLFLAAILTLTLGITRWPDLAVEVAAALSMTYNYVVYDGGPFVLDVLWSLAIEAQFYLLVPFFLIACYTSRRGLAITAAVFLVIGLVVRPLHIYSYTTISDDWLAVRLATHCRLDSLAAGVFAFFLLSQPNAERWVKDLSFSAVRGLALVCILVLAYIPACTPVEFSHNYGFSILAVAAATIVLLAAGSGRYIFPFAGLRAVLRYIGERSFGIYLVHRLTSAAFVAVYPSVVIQERAFGGYGIMMRVINGVCVTLLTLVLAEFMYRFIEQPGIRAGKYFSGKIPLEMRLAKSSAVAGLGGGGHESLD